MIDQEFKINVNKWIRENKEYLRYEYPDLNENSVVIDIGFYKGEFIKRIFEKYGCNIYGFEPVTSFFLCGFSNIPKNDKIHLYNFGISNESRSDFILINNDESSLHKDRENVSDIKMKINLVSFKEIMLHLLNSVNIDLLKINIEGEEYSLLESIIKSGHINLIRNLQVQFHTFIPNAKERREKILEKLDKTHRTIISYPFVWEFFKRKEIKT